MPTQSYEVTQPHVDTLLAWVASGEGAGPEIRRAVGWQATGGSDLHGPLLRGYTGIVVTAGQRRTGVTGTISWPPASLAHGARPAGRGVRATSHLDRHAATLDTLSGRSPG